jgi:hypothetical protein
MEAKVTTPYIPWYAEFLQEPQTPYLSLPIFLAPSVDSDGRLFLSVANQGFTMEDFRTVYLTYTITLHNENNMQIVPYRSREPNSQTFPFYGNITSPIQSKSIRSLKRQNKKEKKKNYVHRGF